MINHIIGLLGLVSVAFTDHFNGIVNNRIPLIFFGFGLVFLFWNFSYKNVTNFGLIIISSLIVSLILWAIKLWGGGDAKLYVGLMSLHYQEPLIVGVSFTIGILLAYFYNICIKHKMVSLKLGLFILIGYTLVTLFLLLGSFG